MSWRMMNMDKKNVWHERADQLNQRPLHGTIEDIRVILGILEEDQTFGRLLHFIREDI